MGDLVKLGIIGGTGVYDLPVLEHEDEDVVRTEYGAVRIQRATYRSRGGTGRDVSVSFVARHGVGHTLPPHRINYHANVRALKKVGADWVLATTAVGSLLPDIHPGELVLLDQFVDFTRTRQYTYFDGGPEGVRHTDMTYPYNEALRQMILLVARERGIDLRPRGTYFCTEGPRFETAAEVRMFGDLGGDVVGMTNVPEVILANEAGLRYAAVSLVTNHGAGISDAPLTHEEVYEVMEENQATLDELICGLVIRLAEGEIETPEGDEGE